MDYNISTFMEREIRETNLIEKLKNSFEGFWGRFRQPPWNYSSSLLPVSEAEQDRIGRLLSMSDVVKDEEMFHSLGLVQLVEKHLLWGEPARPDVVIFCPRLLGYDLRECWLSTTSDDNLVVINLRKGFTHTLPRSEIREVVSFDRRWVGTTGKVLPLLADEIGLPTVWADPNNYQEKTVIRIDLFQGDVALLDRLGKRVLPRRLVPAEQFQPISVSPISELQSVST